MGTGKAGSILETTHHIELAAEIGSAFASNNSLTRGELPTLLEAVHSAIKMLAGRSGAAAVVAEPPVPAVSIRKSITPDYLICLEDLESAEFSATFCPLVSGAHSRQATVR